jgi:hypothetical protein
VSEERIGPRMQDAGAAGVEESFAEADVFEEVPEVGHEGCTKFGEGEME